MTNRVEIISCESGEWYIIKVDDEIIYEGHSIHVFVINQILVRLGFDLAKFTEVSDEEMEATG